MTKKEDLQRQGLELEPKVRALYDKEDRSPDETKEMLALADDLKAINDELTAIGSVEGTLAAIRAPTGEKPKQPDPDNGDPQGFRGFGEYLQAVAAATMARGNQPLGQFPTGIYDRRLSIGDREIRAAEGTGLAESTPALGGFLVQMDFANELFEKAHNASMIWNRCRHIPISGLSNGLKIPGIDETSRADGSRWGGIQVYWLDEAGTKTGSNPKFMMIELSLKKLTGLAYATDELLQDTAALESIITQGFEKEFAFKLDDSVIRGTGAGQPLGILNAPALVSTSRASSGTLADADVLAVYARMFPASHPNAEWFTNVDALPNLMKMKSGDTPLWMPSNNLAGAPFQTLLGRPLHYVETASTEGTVGDLMFLDLSQYVTISKGGLQAEQSIHVRFLQDESAFRFVMRVDGQPLWNSALTPFKGSDTQSPFVTVAS